MIGLERDLALLAELVGRRAELADSLEGELHVLLARVAGQISHPRDSAELGTLRVLVEWAREDVARTERGEELARRNHKGDRGREFRDQAA